MGFETASTTFAKEFPSSRHSKRLPAFPFSLPISLIGASRLSMPIPGACSRCQRALPADSDSGLCPDCRSAELAAPTLSMAAGQLVKTPFVASADDPFSTRSIVRQAISEDFATDRREYFPESPPGYDFIRR